MITAAILFALLSAALELILVLKLVPLRHLKKPWIINGIHILVFTANIMIHFGTIVGTMTAIIAALVSFIVLPLAIWIKTFWVNYKYPQRCPPL